jgi:hypothetical protein
MAPEDTEMTDDEIAKLLTELATALHRLAASLQQRAPQGDWVDAGDGDMITSDDVGFIIGRSPDTAVRWFEAAAAEGLPLGIKRAGVCLFSLRRLLIWIERRKGLPVRLACESRARKLAEMRLEQQKRQQKRQQTVSDAAVAAS